MLPNVLALLLLSSTVSAFPTFGHSEESQTERCRQEMPQVVDMTHPHGPKTLFWPGDPEYQFEIVYRDELEPGVWFELNKFTTADHGGTHLDAPAHFYEGGRRTHQIPIEHLVGPAAVIDIREKAANDPDYQLTVADLKAYEDEYGKIPCGAIVLLNSDWDKYYPDPVLTFGTQTPNDTTTFHFPGYHEEAADWLARYRDVHVIGTDTPSTDYGQSSTYPVHQRLGKAGICGLENVANINKLPPKGATIFVAVMKLFDGSGGPARVIGTFKKENRYCDDK